MRHFWLRSLLFVSDFVVLEAAFFGIYWWRFQTGMFANPVEFTFAEQVAPSVLVSLFWIIHFSVFGMYRFDPLESRSIVVTNSAQAAFYGCFIIFWATFDPNDPLPTTRIILLTYGVGVTAGIAFTRLTLLTILQELRVRGVLSLRTIIVGSGQRVESALRYLQTNRLLGAEVLGVVGNSPPHQHAIPSLGPNSTLRDIVLSNKCDLIYIAIDDQDSRKLSRIVSLTSALPARLFLPADLYQVLLGAVKPIGRRTQQMVEIRRDLLTPIESVLKRVFDIASALLLLVMTLPIWLLATLLTIADSGGPVFYAQTRVGFRGKTFRMLKFRSMIPNAESATGPVIVAKGDPRITRTGRFLRSTRIDELPQLLNVLLGQMSMVGPRPERPEFIDEFSRNSPLFKRRLNVKPGLTGWAQVHLKYDATIFAPEKKLEMDLQYIENMSLPMDIKILFMTLFVVLRGEG